MKKLLIVVILLNILALPLSSLGATRIVLPHNIEFNVNDPGAAFSEEIKGYFNITTHMPKLNECIINRSYILSSLIFENNPNHLTLHIIATYQPANDRTTPCSIKLESRSNQLQPDSYAGEWTIPLQAQITSANTVCSEEGLQEPERCAIIVPEQVKQTIGKGSV